MRLRAVESLLREPPWPVLIVVTLLGWVALVAYRHGTVMAGFCGAASTAWISEGVYAVQATLVFLPARQMAVSWLLMLVAMMTPILAVPLYHLWVRSLRRRRWRAVAVFLAAYAAVWMAMAPILMLAGVTLRVAAGAVGVPGELAAVAVAYVWQATPWQQRCLNRCHWTPRLSAFGLAADRDCLVYGLVNAAWCVGTCWALMLAALAMQGAHLTVMAVGAAVMIAERLRPGRAASWHLPLWGWVRLLAGPPGRWHGLATRAWRFAPRPRWFALRPWRTVSAPRQSITTP
jgi:predicted metal-binding membrane protein